MNSSFVETPPVKINPLKNKEFYTALYFIMWFEKKPLTKKLCVELWPEHTKPDMHNEKETYNHIWSKWMKSRSVVDFFFTLDPNNQNKLYEYYQNARL